MQAKSHVLAHALGALSDDARELLHTIAAFRSPIDYDTLGALFVQRAAWTPQRLDAVLSELEDRGLLGWDRRTNRYDLHPVVRGVVWSGLDDLSRRAIYGAIEQHLSAISADSKGPNSLEEATPLIELFNALVELGRHEDAGRLYFDRLSAGDFDFVASGIGHVKIAMLERLFPDGLDRPPAVMEGAVYAQLGHAYRTAGRLLDAHTCQGEIRQRLDTTVAVPQYVLVVSGSIYNTADTGRVIACRVLPGSPPDDFAGVHPVSYTNLDGISAIGIAVPELLDWYPRSALSAPVGVVANMRPVMTLVHSLFT